MVTAARLLARDQTMHLSQATIEAALQQLRGGRDPLDEIVDRVRPMASEAVDALQVAALLEADGITDRIARVEFGFGDVFELAEVVYSRLNGSGSRVGVRPAARAGGGARDAWRDVSHGLLYLLPSAVFPAVLAFIEPTSVVVALVLAGGLGWLLAGTASWLAYQLLGLGDPQSASRLLCWFTAAGLLAATVLGVAVATIAGGGGRVVAFAAGAMAYQMASTVLTFYRAEVWLAVTMVPAAASGAAYVFAGAPSLSWTLGVGGACVAATLALAVGHAYRAGAAEEGGRGARDPRPVRTLLRRRAGVVTLVVVYTGLSAAYLLHAQVPYLIDGFDVVVTAVPLMLGMGVVEWRARRFVEQARDLLRRVYRPTRFVRRAWLLLAANVAGCVALVALLEAALLMVMHRAGVMSAATVAMAAAYPVLAGAYLLSFVLAGQGEYASLCLALGAALVVHVGGNELLQSGDDPLVDTTLFLCSAVVLQVLLLLAMVPIAGRVSRHR
jgi:hypothetical protein